MGTGEGSQGLTQSYPAHPHVVDRGGPLHLGLSLMMDHSGLHAWRLPPSLSR
jgi:hypothetical protein